LLVCAVHIVCNHFRPSPLRKLNAIPPCPSFRLLILGGVVLFIILAVFLPYIQVLTSLSGP